MMSVLVITGRVRMNAGYCPEAFSKIGDTQTLKISNLKEDPKARKDPEKYTFAGITAF